MGASRQDPTSRWQLVGLLEQRGTPSVWELRQLLASRGISMTLREFTWMFHPAFDRVSLRVLTALCDVLQVDLDSLINVAGSDVAGTSPPPPLSRQLTSPRNICRVMRKWPESEPRTASWQRRYGSAIRLLSNVSNQSLICL
jgi:hypothetical protein